jgi:cholesterol oxidase
MSQVGVRFHEVMKGWLAVPQANFGDSGRAWFEVRAQVFIEDLDTFLADNCHRGQLVGTIDFDGVGHSIPATGHIELFTMSADGATRLMRYQASFGANGVDYMMVGTKHVSKLAGPNVWGHTTTLFITIARSGSDGYGSVAAGVIRLSVWQGARMLFTLRGTGSDLLTTRMNAVFRFIKFFNGSVFAAYFH